MLTTLFIYGTGLINLILTLLLIQKKYSKHLLFCLFSLSFLIPLLSQIGSTIFRAPLQPNALFLIKTYTAVSIVITVCISVILMNFIEVTGTKPVSRINYHKSLILLSGTVVLISLCYSINWVTPGLIDNEFILILNSYGIVLYCFHFLLTIFVLYTIENVYRFAERYQKRIGRICFFALSVIAIYQLIFLTRSILFKTITKNYIETTIIIFGIAYPVFLLGLIRYRLWAEKITVTRGTIYASFTLFFTGAVLLGLAISVYLFRSFGFSFAYFEIFLIIFTCLFLTVLMITSESMRNRITRALNDHIYKSKYDYHQQFLRLHEINTLENTMQQTISMLVDNLQYTLTVKNVYVFMLNYEDGNYYIHRNPDSRIDTNIHIHGNSRLVRAFDDDNTPLDFIKFPTRSHEQDVLETEESLILSLDISSLFPIIYNNRLLGLLALKRTRGVELDLEDLNFINVFTESIGDVFFKSRILEERIEHKQFESFSHIASFIIHDIKNQVSTLSLVTKNAKHNINNPEFQQSLLHSLNSCVSNLQSLINKFAAPPKQEALQVKAENINTIIQEVIDSTNIQKLDTLQVRLNLNAGAVVHIDRNSLFYIIMNLVTNALEAMHYRGIVTISADDIGHMPTETLKETGISENLLYGKKVIVKVTDTGKGMSREFISTKLFHPFSSTKDKGIGIGLYQCKILLEKMDGKILCKSTLNKGTTFYIFL